MAAAPLAAVWELRVDEQCGRGLWATKDIAAGERVLVAHVFAAGVSVASCAYCLRNLPREEPSAGAVPRPATSVRCTGCSLRYCAQACADADAGGADGLPRHKPFECALLARLHSSAEWDSPLVRLLVRLLTAVEADDAATVGARSCADVGLAVVAARLGAEPSRAELRASDVRLLDPCRARVPTGRYTDVCATAKFVGRAWRKAAATVGAGAPAEPADVQGTLCRIMHNGFGVRDSAGVEVGCALLPTASMFNHDCEPSCKVAAPLGGARASRCLEFVSTRAVSRGEQLTISYVDVALPREARRAKLKESYYFDCQCARCGLVVASGQHSKRRRNEIRGE
jgi:hypothetical protein